MFEWWKLWRLERAKAKLFKRYDQEVAELDARNADDGERGFMEHQYTDAFIDADRDIDTFKSDRLIRVAHKIDARIPAGEDTDFWVQADHNYGYRAYLNTTGRDLLKTRIKEVKDRDFDDWAKWVKLLTPIVSAILTTLVGIIGALIGLYSITHQNKNAPPKQPHSYEQILGTPRRQ